MDSSTTTFSRIMLVTGNASVKRPWFGWAKHLKPLQCKRIVIDRPSSYPSSATFEHLTRVLEKQKRSFAENKMAEFKWMVYGANGYTGKLIAKYAHEMGLKPILAGRTKDRVGSWSSFVYDRSLWANVLGLFERACQYEFSWPILQPHINDAFSDAFSGFPFPIPHYSADVTVWQVLWIQSWPIWFLLVLLSSKKILTLFAWDFLCLPDFEQSLSQASSDLSTEFFTATNHTPVIWTQV
jgi:hypothetical protein